MGHIPSRRQRGPTGQPSPRVDAARRLWELAGTPVDEWRSCPLCDQPLQHPVNGAAWCTSDERAYCAPMTEVVATDVAEPQITGVREQQPLLSEIREGLHLVPTVMLLRPRTMYRADGFMPPPAVREVELMKLVADHAG